MPLLMSNEAILLKASTCLSPRCGSERADFDAFYELIDGDI